MPTNGVSVIFSRNPQLENRIVTAGSPAATGARARFFARLVQALVAMANEQWIRHPRFAERWRERRRAIISDIVKVHIAQSFTEPVELPEMRPVGEMREWPGSDGSRRSNDYDWLRCGADQCSICAPNNIGPCRTGDHRKSDCCCSQRSRGPSSRRGARRSADLRESGIWAATPPSPAGANGAGCGCTDAPRRASARARPPPPTPRSS